MNKNRRKFLKNSCCALTSAMLVSLSSGQYVWADARDLPEYCSLQGGLFANGIEMLSTSGDRDLDRSLNFELIHLSESLNVLPGFGFYDDSDGPNAFALNENVIPNTQGTVVFGIQLLSEELNRHSWGGLAVAGIMAHEFAHIYQYQSGIYRLLTCSQPTHRLLELHADYLAGYYLGLKRLRSGEIDIKAFLNTLYLKGDTDFTSPGHHGTPLERKSVMLEGYKTGLTNNTDVHQVAEMGMEFVKNI